MSRLATQIPADVASYIAKNAGVIVSDFATSGDGAWTVNRAKIIGATSGGINFTDTPEWSDFGEDIDNCPKNTMELKELDSREVKLSCMFVALNPEGIEQVIAAADYSSKAIIPRDSISETDFKTLWFVFDYGTDNAVAIKINNALSTDGLSIQTSDKAKAQFSMGFTAHYSMNNPETVPYEIHFKS